MHLMRYNDSHSSKFWGLPPQLLLWTVKSLWDHSHIMMSHLLLHPLHRQVTIKRTIQRLQVLQMCQKQLLLSSLWAIWGRALHLRALPILVQSKLRLQGMKRHHRWTMWSSILHLPRYQWKIMRHWVPCWDDWDWEGAILPQSNSDPAKVCYRSFLLDP